MIDMAEKQQEMEVKEAIGMWVECGNDKTLRGSERVNKCTSRVLVVKSIDPKFLIGECGNCGIRRIEKVLDTSITK